MILYRKPPTHITVDGKRYKLRPWFDRVLYAMEIMQNEKYTAMQKLDAVAYLLIANKRIKDKARVVGAALDLLLGKGGNAEEKRYFDFEQDAEYIFSSFQQAYGINLFERMDLNHQKPMHWWEFIALFTGLPDSTRMAQVIAIRSKDIPAPAKGNEEYRTSIMKQKAIFALKTSERERQENLQKGLAALYKTMESMAKGG